jgi:hypothetical protein
MTTNSLWLHALTALLLAPLAVSDAADTPTPPRPRLQIINGSNQTVDIFWLKSDTERVSNGSVAPGKNTVITTTLGHRFEVVGRDDKAAATVTSEVPVQGFRFDPHGRYGVPAFYTQSVSANGYPIVASAKVNPYALKEAAYLVNMMLAKRPEVRTAMIKSGARLCIMAYNEFTTNLPEFARTAGKDLDVQSVSLVSRGQKIDKSVVRRLVRGVPQYLITITEEGAAHELEIVVRLPNPTSRGQATIHRRIR